MTVIAEVLDWFDHLRVRPNHDGLYPHPGMWLTRGDYTEHWIVWQVMRFDSAVIAPAMCRLGRHRRTGCGAPATEARTCLARR